MIGLLRSLKRRLFNNRNPQPAPVPHFGLQPGANFTMGVPRRLEGIQYITVGDNVQIGKEAWIGAYDSYPYSGQKFNPEIRIANDVFIGSSATITCINKIIMEEGVEVADFVYISDHMHSYTPEEGVPPRKRRLFTRGYVKIGAFTGIGIYSVILPGVTIGKYCLIGAHSVVTHSFPDYSLIMGNPAKVVKTYDPVLKKWIDPIETSAKRVPQDM